MERKIIMKYLPVKIFVYLVLASLLAFAMIGCAQENGTSGSETSGSTTDGIVNVTILAQWESEPNLIETSAVYRGIGEATGVNIEFILADAEKAGLLLASGDLPDIINPVFSFADHSHLVRTGHILELSELLESHGQDFISQFPEALDFIRKFYSADTGGLYFVPGARIGGNAYPVENDWALTIRWDIYKEIGYPEINSPDQLLDVLKQMVDYYPETEDGLKTYGLSSFIDWGLEYQFQSYSVSWFGTFTYENLIYTFLSERGQPENIMVNNLTDTGSMMWEQVEWFFKANQLGIFDRDGLTQGWDQFQSKYTAGQVMLCDANWATGEFTFDPENITAGRGYVAIPIVGYGTLYEYPGFSREAPLGWPGYQNAISTNSNHPEKAMELLNFLASPDGARLIYSGIRDEQWGVIDGVAQPLPETLALRDARGPEWEALQINSGQLYSFCPMFPLWTHPEDGQILDLFLGDDVQARGLIPMHQDFSDFYGVTFPGQIFREMLIDGRLYTLNNKDNEFAVAAMGPLSDDMKLVEERIRGQAMVHFADCILASDYDDFIAKRDAAIADFIANGVNDVYAEYEKIFNDAVEATKNLS